MFNKSLTVVLPVYNGETRLRKSVDEILELASELTSKFGVLIVDDGSNDSTYEVAEELAARYPQISVHRNRQRRGLGSMIDYAQRRIRSDAVIVHDGVTPINAGEIRTLWRDWIGQSQTNKNGAGEPAAKFGRMSELANLPSIHQAMERTHRRLCGFQMVAPISDDESLLDSIPPADASTRRSDTPRNERKSGIGQVPPLPRPKFLRSIANFALGE